MRREVVLVGLVVLSLLTAQAYGEGWPGEEEDGNNTTALEHPSKDDVNEVLEATDENCPDWLPGYAEWHAANRGKPDATYLVQYCPKGIKCLGIGDRSKGIMVLLRLAALYKKVLLIVWEDPEPVTHYLTPNRIDWTLDGLPQDVLDRIAGEESTPFDLHLTGMMLELIGTGRHDTAFQAAKVIRLQSNLWYGMTMHGSNDLQFLRKYGRNQFGRCLFKFLFKISDELERLAFAKLKELYGVDDPRPYSAWHWRLGGMVNERVLHRTDKHPGRAEQKYSRMQTMMAVLPCAEYWAHKKNRGPSFHERPLLLVTDHNILRQWAARGEFKSIVAAPAKVIHMNYATVESNRDTWTDLAMLSMAKCFFYSKSGFSNVAIWMGASDCTKYYLQCVTSATFLNKTPI